MNVFGESAWAFRLPAGPPADRGSTTRSGSARHEGRGEGSDPHTKAEVLRLTEPRAEPGRLRTAGSTRSAQAGVNQDGLPAKATAPTDVGGCGAAVAVDVSPR